MPHYLDPLLNPASIAVVGASRRENTVGNLIIVNLLRGKYPGRLYAVNPRYEDIEGVRCYASVDALPEPVDHVAFAVSDKRIEEALEAAIVHGAKSATIMSTLVLADDADPCLRERIRDRVRAAAIPLCGGNGMGFYNFREGIWMCGFATRMHRRGGNVTFISQSGSGMSGIIDVEGRIDFNLAVSSGQELNVTLEDYLDYALEQDETRVVGLFMETSRDPGKFAGALEKAAARKIPVVVIKTGKTALSAQLAESHSGAMTGSEQAYAALFRKYGVQRVDDIDDLVSAMIMFAQPHAPAKGGLVSLHDSGGERQLTIDLADKLGVELATLTPQTVTELESILDPGLPAVNPLDAWSAGGENADAIMRDSFRALCCDDNAALGAVIQARAPDSGIHLTYLDYLRAGHESSAKPVFLVAGRQGTGSDDRVVEFTRLGFPVLDGISHFLTATRCLLRYRDYQATAHGNCLSIAEPQLDECRALLETGVSGEAAALRLLAAAGLCMNRFREVSDENGLLDAAAEFGYPLVLKTANPAIRHKTDVGGVITDLASAQALRQSYRLLAGRHGPRALVAPMLGGPGQEMILGMSTDEQFGPVIIMGFGGVYTEVLADTVCLLPPFSPATARRALAELRLFPLLCSQRGRNALAIDSYCEAAARLSTLAVELQSVITEIDINPVLLHEQGYTGLDALVITREQT